MPLQTNKNSFEDLVVGDVFEYAYDGGSEVEVSIAYVTSVESTQIVIDDLISLNNHKLSTGVLVNSNYIISFEFIRYLFKLDMYNTTNTPKEQLLEKCPEFFI